MDKCDKQKSHLVSIYTGIDFSGECSQIAKAGDYGKMFFSSTPMYLEISSMKIRDGVIMIVKTGSTLGSAKRVFKGPMEIPNLGSISDKIVSMTIMEFDPAQNQNGEPVSIYKQNWLSGVSVPLISGEYRKQDLSTLGFPDDVGIQSASIPKDVLAIFYDGPEFNSLDADAFFTVGPVEIQDFSNVGLSNKVSSVRILRLTSPNEARFMMPFPGLKFLEDWRKGIFVDPRKAYYDDLNMEKFGGNDRDIGNFCGDNFLYILLIIFVLMIGSCMVKSICASTINSDHGSYSDSSVVQPAT
jgi:hypothetical protein